MALRTPTLDDRTRPAGRPAFDAERRPPQARPDFDTLFAELLTARRHYDDLRAAGGGALDRVAARDHLHSLRASLAGVRSSMA